MCYGSRRFTNIVITVVAGVVRKQTDENAESTRRTYLSTAGAALGVTALASGTAAAGECKKKDTEDSKELDTSDGELIVIDESGTFELEDDIELEEGETGILIITDDVTLNGNGNTISGDGEGRGIFVDNDAQDQGADDVTIDNLVIENLEIGIELFEPLRTRILDTSVEDCDTGFIQTNDTDETILRDNTFDNAPVIFQESARVAIINNTFDRSPSAGLILEDSNDFIIINNNVIDNEGPGILLENSSSNQLLNNLIEVNGGAGIEFEGSDSNRVIRNESISNNPGVEIDDESDDNDILDNILEDNAGGPCDVDEDASGNVFSGNVPECDEVE